MPDLRTALETALSKAQPTPTIPAEWDDETTNATITEVSTMQTQQTTPRVYFQTTNNVTRVTFNYVRDNPGLTRIAVAQALEKQGFKKASTTSLLGQMVKQGHMREVLGGLYTNQSEYTPLKSAKVFANKLAKEAKFQQPKVEKKVARVASTNTLLADVFDAEKFVDGMTLKQAKAVYDVLSKIFKS